MNYNMLHIGETSQFGEDVLAGFAKAQKEIPCRWLYDRKGSALFEEITRLPEYYPTRTEVGILQAHAQDIAEFIGRDAVVVEYGAGAATKTRLLLDALSAPQAYIPVDISEGFLDLTEQRLRAEYPAIEICGVAGDFLDPALALDLPPHFGPSVGFFPGSTVGNMTDTEIVRFFRSARGSLGANNIFVVGFDLKKDPAILIPAYDDAAGVTAAFNLNLLTRINRELGGDFNLQRFRHKALWNSAEDRIEMHLVSLQKQEISLLGRRFRFAEGETIHTENSRKFDIGNFSELLHRAGWRINHLWTDSRQYFAVALLAPLAVSALFTI